MLRMVLLVVACLGAAAVAALDPAAAAAHVPVLEPSRSSDAVPEGDEAFPAALDLPDPSISRAVYGTLAAGEAFDAWRFRVGETVTLPLEALTPTGEEQRDFRPRLTLLGPGLPAPSDEVPEEVGRRLDLLPGWGAVVVADPGSAERERFFEPFSLSSYFKGGEAQVTLQQGERYVLIVDEPGGRTGEYTVGIGRKEQFGVEDALSAPVAVARFQLGLYGQASADLSTLAVVLLAVAAVVLAAVWLRRLRRSPTAADR